MSNTNSEALVEVGNKVSGYIRDALTEELQRLGYCEGDMFNRDYDWPDPILVQTLEYKEPGTFARILDRAEEIQIETHQLQAQENINPVVRLKRLGSSVVKGLVGL